MDDSAYTGWMPAIELLVAHGGTVLLLGATDTGKTTFATLLANRALAVGRRVCVVDADVGQSEIGPPSCVGMGLATQPIRTLGDIAAKRLAFVGSTSPRGRMLEHATATRLMTDAAGDERPDLMVVDTTGFIEGAGAHRLKEAKIALLRARHVVALQRRSELEPILRAAERNASLTVYRLLVPPVIARKPPAYRAQRRMSQIASYFAGVQPQRVGFDETAFSGTWLNGGQPLPPHLLKFVADAIGLRVYYGEMADRHLGLVVASVPDSRALTQVHEQLRYQSVTTTPVSALRHLLVGISDGEKTLGIGLIDSIDFGRRLMSLITPLRLAGIARVLTFGALRLRPEGQELGAIRPGDV